MKAKTESTQTAQVLKIAKAKPKAPNEKEIVRLILARDSGPLYSIQSARDEVAGCLERCTHFVAGASLIADGLGAYDYSEDKAVHDFVVWYLSEMKEAAEQLTAAWRAYEYRAEMIDRHGKAA